MEKGSKELQKLIDFIKRRCKNLNPLVRFGYLLGVIDAIGVMSKHPK